MGAEAGAPSRRPRFSVVMAAYDASATIEAAVQSVLAQSCADLELIVVDDGSTDETPERVLAFGGDARVRLIQQENRGLAGARNAGLAAAHGPYVGLLDADDLWAPTYLERMGEALEAHPEAGFGYTDAWVLDGTTGQVARAPALDRAAPLPPSSASSAELLMRLLERNFVIASTATVRRSVLDDLGGFDSRMPGSEDFELWLRIAASGRTAVRPEGRLAVYRHTQGSMSSDELAMTTSLRAVYRVVGAEYDLSEEARAAIRGAMRRADRRIAMLEGRRRVAARATALRRALGAARRRLRARSIWHSKAPSEFRAAFPYLEAPTGARPGLLERAAPRP